MNLTNFFYIFLSPCRLISRTLDDLIKCVYVFIKSMLPKSVEREIVVITDAGHGIGRELAFLYAAAGAIVIAWDTDRINNEKTVSQINKKYEPVRAFAYYCDLTDKAQVFNMARKIENEVGNITILISNAVLFLPVLTQPREEVEKVFSLNLLAHFWIIQAFLPSMKRKRRGHIVAISSFAGIVGFPNLIPYCISKCAVIGMMETLEEQVRRERVSRIKFTTIYPSADKLKVSKQPKVESRRLSEKSAAIQIMVAQRTGRSSKTIPGLLVLLKKRLRMIPEES